MNLDRRLLRQARKSYFALALTIALGFGAGVLTVLQAGYLSRVVNRVFLGGHSLGQVAGLLASLVGVMLLRALLAWGGEMAANAIAARVKIELRRALVERILAQGPAYARGERSGELSNLALQGIESLDAYFSQYLPGLALAALVPLAILAFVFPLDPLSGIILLLTAPLIPAFMTLIGNAAQALTRRQWVTLSRMSAYFLDVLQGLTTLKILGRSKAQSRVIADVSERFRQATMSVLRVTFLSALALEMIATLSTAVVAVQIGLRLLYGRLAFEQALFILLLAPEFYLPLRLLGTRFHAGMSGVEAAKRVFEVLGDDRQATEDGRREPDDLAIPEGDAQAPAWGGRSAAEVRFEDVAFAYEDGRQALRGVSLAIPAGEKVALVGPSGSGKSSIAHLLLRFIRPGAGRITVGGLPLEGIPAQEWRQGVAWVSQNPYLFDDTVAANIRLARPEASLEQVIQAAQAAHAHEFIQALPQGYDTQVGERGARLSGGQAQRIALARAFLKEAWLVVLDEATANLDPEHEALLQESLERLLAGRSALIIAHRLNTVRLAGRVLVLEQGQVVESGTQAELLARGGLYWRMAQAFSGETARQAAPAGAPEAGLELSARQLQAMRPWLSRSLRAESLSPPSLSKLSISPPGYGQALQILRRLVQLIGPFKGWVALSVLMGAATILSGVGLMTTSAYLISAAALQPSIADLQVAIVGVRFFGIARGVFRYLERYLSHQTTFLLLARLRAWFYQALEPLAPARLMGYRSGDLLARILGDIESLENFYVRALALPLTAALTGLALCAFLARFDPLLGLTLAVFLLAAGALVPLLAHALGKGAGRQIVTLQASLSVASVDMIQGLAELAAFGGKKRQAAQVEALSQALAGAQRRMAAVNGLQSALSGLLANLGMWAVLVSAIPLVQSGQIQGVHLAVLALAALTSFEAVLPLPLAAQYLEGNLQAARRLFEVVDARAEVQDPPQPPALPQGLHLSARDLRFRYPTIHSPDSRSHSEDERPWVLDGLSFDLPQGKRLAIVGPSGAGKSTLAHLLLRFWECDQGQMLLNGQDLRQYAQDEWRQEIAFVSQNTYLFSASIGDNLRLAMPAAEQAQIESAARWAQLDGFIQSLPEGYQTWVGEWGLRLSGGERQRLALARALLKGAPLLILDEPTANLDALTERRVLDGIQRLMEGRTTLLITHRLVGMETMDEIIVLERGKAVERGRHAELLQAGKLYRRMWDLQRSILMEHS
ncbi:MAG: thiol reductant ABC exporter subunit CydD [Anaerolineales bacterium]|nr:thiol reductant ABC exporter subunit CydD [Anaerolineales bacterium]